MLICACLIGSHVIDLEIAELSSWIINTEPNCTNDMGFTIGSTWLNMLCFISYIGILTAFFLYLTVLIKHTTIMYIALILYIIIVIFHEILTIGICCHFWNVRCTVS